MITIFGNFDMSDFWDPSEYADTHYVGRPLDDETIRTVEQQVGYKLPASYVEFMKVQNGGVPRLKKCRTKEANSWANDHIEISGLFAIGDTPMYSLCGKFKNQFWIDEWGYPPIGVYFANCPSAGHDMVCLDYSECGPTGEPRVAHIDQEYDYKKIVLADNFEAFIRALEADEAFEQES